MFYVSVTFKSETSLKIPIKLQVTQMRPSQLVWASSISLIFVLAGAAWCGARGALCAAGAGQGAEPPGLGCPCFAEPPGQPAGAQLPRSRKRAAADRSVSFSPITGTCTDNLYSFATCIRKKTLLWKFSLSHRFCLFNVFSHAKFVIRTRFFAVQIMPNAPSTGKGYKPLPMHFYKRSLCITVNFQAVYKRQKILFYL